jgi:hypothetical protein
MKYDEMLNHYTKEYEKYLNMGLSKEDAITLIEKRVKEDKQIKKASPYDLINLFAGYDVWKDTFVSFEREMNTLMEQITKCLEYPNKKEEKTAENPSKSEPFVVDKKEEKIPIRVE